MYRSFLIAAYLAFVYNLVTQPFQLNDNVSSVLPSVSSGCVSWIDYDIDGDYDILISGETLNGDVTDIYRQENGIFYNISAGLPGLKYSDASWSDNDNDPDLFITGVSTVNEQQSATAYLFKNTNGIFELAETEFTPVFAGSAKWGDIDNDGDEDFLLDRTHIFSRRACKCCVQECSNEPFQQRLFSSFYSG